jgi:hypothetical protein
MSMNEGDAAHHSEFLREDMAGDYHQGSSFFERDFDQVAANQDLMASLDELVFDESNPDDFDFAIPDLDLTQLDSLSSIHLSCSVDRSNLSDSSLTSIVTDHTQPDLSTLHSSSSSSPQPQTFHPQQDLHIINIHEARQGIPSALDDLIHFLSTRYDLPRLF